MSLKTKIENALTRVGTEFKAVRALIGLLADLNTSQKGTVVAAINDLQAQVTAAAQSGGAAIDDAGTSASTVWSSSKTAGELGTVDAKADQNAADLQALVNGAPDALNQINELAAALGDDANFAATTADSLSKRVRVDAAQPFTAAQKTQALANIGAVGTAAIGDVDAADFVGTFEAAIA